MASETVRDTVIGERVEKTEGIDNSRLLLADLDNLDWNLTIRSVEEDGGYYYVGYSFNTLDIKDNSWQSVSKSDTLQVSKKYLGQNDLGLYITEELGEVIDSQRGYLKKVQEKENKIGKTQIVQTTTYTRLLGLVLNSKTKTLPGYEPVVKPPVTKEVDNNRPLDIPATTAEISINAGNITIQIATTTEEIIDIIATSTDSITINAIATTTDVETELPSEGSISTESATTSPEIIVETATTTPTQEPTVDVTVDSTVGVPLEPSVETQIELQSTLEPILPAEEEEI